jgi:hypothetical protein
MPNRIASYLTAAAALLGGIAIPVANLDPESSAGIITGVVGVLVVFREWLKGWRGHEWREAAAEAGANGVPPGPAE